MPDEAPHEKPDGRAPEDDDEGNERTSPFGWPALVIIALLIVGGWFLITTLSADSNMQDCVQSGRRNCAPIDTTGK